jgi:hypothetical protein
LLYCRKIGLFPEPYSKKIKGVVKNTQEVEALSFMEGLDACYYMSSILQEIVNSETIGKYSD